MKLMRYVVNGQNVMNAHLLIGKQSSSELHNIHHRDDDRVPLTSSSAIFQEL